MPSHKISHLPQAKVSIAFEVSWDEAKPYLDEAVIELTTAKPIPGFRPGKATYEDAKRAFGEMRILETALERIVRANYVKTVLAEKLETVGSPAVAVDQLVPNDTIKFTTTTALMPTVTKLPDFTACKVEQKIKTVDETQLDEAIDQLRKMRRVETPVEREASLDDLVIIDLEMKKAGVQIEGGNGRDYRVYLGESQYIPGLSEKLTGIKANEERSFTLPFPADHFQKQLAGQEIEFTAKAKGVYELRMPPADEAFAKTLGLETIQALRDKLRENMQDEHAAKGKEAAEIEMLEKLTEAASFSEVPEILANDEVRRMLSELEHGVEDQGMKWPDYLASIKKSAGDLKMEFVPQALKRIKTAILIKGFAKQENIAPTEAELDQEIDKILEQLRPDDAETRERVTSPDYREYVEIQMRNRKTIEWLKTQCIKI